MTKRVQYALRYLRLFTKLQGSLDAAIAFLTRKGWTNEEILTACFNMTRQSVAA